MSKQQDQKKKPQQKEDNLQQEKLIAIVLLDSYTNKFEPLSSYRAECLLPLAGGKTLLDNNIQFLIENGVEELFLFCTKHHQQIRNHIEEKKWRKQIEIHFLYNFKCQCFGDAMREIDAKGLINSNFILVTAPGFISNISLKEHLETHKQLCKTDKNTLMTMMCMSKQNDLTYLNENDQSSTLIVHNNNRKILHYDNITSREFSKVTKFPFSVLEKAYDSGKQTVSQQAVDTANAKFKLQQKQTQFTLNATSGYQGGSVDTVLHLKKIQNRNDLVESQIYMCSPYVLHMFTDNFDYESMRDFVHGVLADEEVSGYTIYIDEFKQKYGAHFSLINSLNSYYNETMKLLQRVDLVLDYYTRVKYRRLLDSINVHLAKNSTMPTSNSKFMRNVFVDSNTKIGENCHLVNCFIGSNCLIGDNVKLTNCIIWPNSKIGSSTIINGSWLGSNCKIGNDVHVPENTLFSDYCKVKNNTKITERAVYYTKEAEKLKAKQKTTDSHTDDEKDKIENLTKNFQNLNLDVSESNYVKYILNNKALTETDDEGDDEFSDEDYDNEEEEDDASVSSARSEEQNIRNDTSKNNHFLVLRKRVRKESRSESRLRKQNQYCSDLDMSCMSSNELDSSSDEDDFDRDDSDIENESEDEETNAHEDETETFFKEVVSLLRSALKENLESSNVILEINSRKHANGIQIDDVCYYLAKAVLDLPIVLSGINRNKTLKEQQEAGQKLDYLTSLKSYLKKFILIIQNYYTKTKQSQRIFLNALQDFFIETRAHSDQAPNSFLDANYVKAIHYMYNDLEILDEDIVIEWYDKQVEFLKSSQNADLEKMDPQQRIQAEKIIRKAYSITKLKDFVDWLKQDDDDDEDEEDDE
ncbi:unnamed protein product [Brachionus calyciflorus]|uniref:Translation initiation factor eIF2B subunit epsilon n=1 Tax=Brachionus calyciflorus TaxID=104777 RepID=A0A814EKI8_9BILA|nr:unnamed protein product [Brachionus calyciflorus]